MLSILPDSNNSGIKPGPIHTVIDAGRTPGVVTERTIWGNPTFVSFR